MIKNNLPSEDNTVKLLTKGIDTKLIFVDIKTSMFSTIATFQYSNEAQIVKGRLLAEGITAFLVDNYTIDTDPLVSNAIGGVKLRVPSEDQNRAKKIVQHIAQFSVDDEGKALQCPNCKSNKIQLFTTVTDIKSLSAFLIGLLFATLPFYTKYEYRCLVCKHKFNEL